MIKAVITSIFIILSILVHGQSSRNIEGIVLDSDSKEPLVGASVTFGEKSNLKGTFTNEKGAFSLSIPSTTEKMNVSLVGYATQEVSVLSQSFISISLVLGNTLDEIVVTALGLERDSKNLGYAVQQIAGSKVSDVKSTNFIDNLGGRIAGLTVNSGSSGLGSTSKITIRGESSFTNNNPLFIVDGIPINNNTVVNITSDAAAGFQEIDFGNGAMDINSDDIQNVSILKGPSAAALYGTRASNGVVIVTTKDGSKQKGMGVSFNSSTMVETAFILPQFQNTYGQGNNGVFEYKDGLGGGKNDNITYSYGPKLDIGLNIPQYDSPVTLPDGGIVRGGDIAIHGGLPITPTPFVSHPDNLKNFYNTGYTTINNLAVSSGSRNSTFRLSLTDLNSESIIPGVNLNRRTFSGSFNFAPTEKLKVNARFNYINSNSDNRPSTKYGSENINYSLVAWLGRQTNLEPMKQYWQPGLENVQQYSYNYTFFDNPYFILLENRNSFDRNRLFGNIAFSYDLSPNLSVQLRSGMDYQNEKREFRRAFSTNRFKNGAFAQQNVLFKEVNTDAFINYNKSFDGFGVDIILGGNRMDQSASQEQTQALSLAQPNVFSLQNAASPLGYFQNVGNKRINSIYGITKLSYLDYAFLDITGRNDWSSALASPNSTANTGFFYPSFSGALVISNLINFPNAISFLKLRSSYAEVGNDTNPYQTVGFYQSRTSVGGLPTFGDQATIANSNLLPERISSKEFGLDIRFFRDKLKLDLTYFNSLSENQIISLPITIASGYTQQNINGGVINNKGWEAILSYRFDFKNDFTWNSMVNFSSYQSIVKSLPKEAKTVTLAYNRIYDNTNQTVWYQVQEGGRLGELWGTGYLKNSVGQYIIAEDGKYIVDNELRKIGNYSPDFIIGFVNQIDYKKASLNFLIDWRQGGEIVSRTQALAGVAGQLKETEFRPENGIIAEGVVNIGSKDNPIYQANTKAISAETYYRQYYDRNHEENNTIDATYVKLREVSFSYEISGKWMSNRIDKLHLSLIGRNLFAISKIRHFDPEQVAFQGQNVLSGVEDMAYPTTRSYGLKLSLSF